MSKAIEMIEVIGVRKVSEVTPAGIAPRPLARFRVDALAVEVYRTRAELGIAAAIHTARRLQRLLARRRAVSVVFAAAPSQDELLEALATAAGIDWERVVAFQMDEYVGLPEGAPQRFAAYLDRRIVGCAKPGNVHYLDGTSAEPVLECGRYSALLRQWPPDVVCMGIGENGHIAFNDPEVADFADPVAVKVVELDLRSRMQQVHDGCFRSLEEVPTHAMTMTVPALMSGGWVFCVVPGQTKTDAIARTLDGPVSADCPASILRRHRRARLFLDTESAAGLRRRVTRW